MKSDLKDLLHAAAPPVLPPPDGLDQARRRARVLKRRATAARLLALPLVALLLLATVTATRDSSRVNVVPAEREDEAPGTQQPDEVTPRPSDDGSGAAPTPSKGSPSRTAASTLASPAGGPSAGAPAPGRIAFMNDQGIWTIGLDGTRLRRVSSQQHQVEGWSADGRRLLLASRSETEQRQTASWLDLDTGRVTVALDHPGYSVSGPRMSPDGKYLAYTGIESHGDVVTGYETTDHLFIADAQGRVVRELPWAGRELTWSPDSKRLAFNCDERARQATGSYLCIIEADGTGLRGVGHRFGPVAWSPDGHWLLGRGINGFAVYRTDGTDERTVKARSNLTPGQWTPDGRHVVYVRAVQPSGPGGVCRYPPCDEPPGIYAAPLNGGEHIRLTTGPNDDYPLVSAR